MLEFFMVLDMVSLKDNLDYKKDHTPTIYKNWQFDLSNSLQNTDNYVGLQSIGQSVYPNPR